MEKVGRIEPQMGLDSVQELRAVRAARSANGPVVRCPGCKSTHVMMRSSTGLGERLAILFTGERKYRCRLCDCKFRATDPKKDSHREF